MSCYIAGGTGTFRREQPDAKGAPDKLCILPAGHQSAWVINGQIRLAHLYFSQEQFALAAPPCSIASRGKCNCAKALLPEDPQQAQRFRQLIELNWGRTGRTLAHQQPGPFPAQPYPAQPGGLRQGLRLKGGLAAHQRRHLVDYIEQHLEQPISLGELAGHCALSEYQFARMFRESFGLPPHQYLLARRLARARELLRNSRQPLGEVALACGFASASHFANRFKQALGGTPGEYRLAVWR